MSSIIKTTLPGVEVHRTPKKCSKCGEVYMATPAMIRHWSPCQACKAKYRKAYLSSPDGRATRKAYKSSPSGKATRKAYESSFAGKAVQKAARKKYNLAHRVQKSCWKSVENAIKRGDLKRLSCETCGEAQGQAHHDYYDRNDPLAVRWLCDLHHREWHTSNTASVIQVGGNDV